MSLPQCVVGRRSAQSQCSVDGRKFDADQSSDHETDRTVLVSGRSDPTPASPAIVRLFQKVLNREHVVQGFRNGNIREALYRSTKDVNKRRCQIKQNFICKCALMHDY